MIETIDLHGLTLEQAKEKLLNKLISAHRFGESVVRIIHGQGKHSEVFPVIKSFVRHWLEDSEFSQNNIKAIFRGEDGSPYTSPNAGETIVVFKGSSVGVPILDIEADEEREARRNAKSIRADRLRTARRRGPRLK